MKRGGILTKTSNDTEIDDKSNDDLSMPLLLIKKEMYTMDYGDESDYDLIFTEMLEDIHDGSQFQPNIIKRYVRYKICDCIRQR